MNKRTIINAGVSILCGLIATGGLFYVAVTEAGGSVEPLDEPLQLSSALGVQHYEIRIPGRKNAVHVTEFISKRGDPCILVFSTNTSPNFQLSCNYK